MNNSDVTLLDDDQPSRPVKHARPKLSTVQLLYGTALRCAKPDCSKPLYNQNNDTGDLTLNSRVAHIHARSENGPRWNPDMTEEENRDAANLLLLCIEHSYEVDEIPERYPTDMLRDWKRQQLAEHQEVQRSWPLTEDQAEEVAAASFDAQAAGVTSVGALSLVNVGRAIGMLAETAKRVRGLPLQAALAWKAAHDRATSTVYGHDDEGNSIHGRLSRREMNEHRGRLGIALAQASEAVSPLADGVNAELHAIRIMLPQLEKWCDWIESDVAAVLEVSGTWAAPPPFDDDAALSDSLESLRRASHALTAAWRGESADEPPPPRTIEEPVPDTREIQLSAHRDLLEAARPWTRVDHKPFDSVLYHQLREAMRFALTLPPVPSLLPLDLIATARLAAAVARNSDDADLQRLIEEPARLCPVAVAAALLQNLSRIAEKSGRQSLQGLALAQLTELLVTQPWVERDVWLENENYGRQVLGLTAYLSSDDHVRSTLASALNHDRELLEVMLPACAVWVEQRDIEDWSFSGTKRHLEELPSWFPIAMVVEEIKLRFPTLSPADEWASERYPDEIHRLASNVLHAAKVGT